MPKANILVIDDEEIVRACCARALLAEGYEVDVTASGKDGLELFGRKSYDLVLIDLKMPSMEGMEVLEHIKRAAPDQKAIIITGYMPIEQGDELTELESVNYIEKPFAPDELITRINEVLDK